MIELQPQDDLTSVCYRLASAQEGRIILVVPWDMRFLSRELDFDLLRREVERRNLQVAIVSADPDRRQVAHGRGLPAFASVGEAETARVWRSQPLAPVEPPPRRWWDEAIDFEPRPVRPLASWFKWARAGIRAVAFLLSLALVALTTYTVVPSAEVTLVPSRSEFVVIVPVSVDLEVEEIDLESRLIPARPVGDWFEGYLEVETSGLMDVFVGRATGTVIFTNLLAQDYTVPTGTIVRTSSTSYPIRFRTTADVIVPAGGQAAAPIEALEDRGGNVAAFQINQVEGVAGSAVRVINPESTTGADPREARVVVQADYDRAADLLRHQLLEQAYIVLAEDYLESTEILLHESLFVADVGKQAYDRFIGEQADAIGLDMRLLISGWAVDLDNAETVAYTVLSQHVPYGQELLDVQFAIGELAEEEVGLGAFTLFVTAHGTSNALLNTAEAASLIRGKRVADARESLLAEFPLAAEPRITLWPAWPERLKWLERMPLIPLRISVRVEPQIPAGLTN